MDPILSAANTQKTMNMVSQLGLNMNTYNLADTSPGNVALFNLALGKYVLLALHAEICQKTGSSCTLNSFTQLATEARNILNVQNNIGSVLGYTATDSSTANILTQAGIAMQKSKAVDSNYATITGSSPSNNPFTDVGIYTKAAASKPLYIARIIKVLTI